MTFLYTRCPDVCLAIGQFARTSSGSGGAREVTMLGVSVDPSRDSPQAARLWIDRQRLPHSFHYLVGSRRDLAPVWKAYFAAPQIPGRPETRSHTASTWLIDAGGRLCTRYSAGAPVRPEDLAHDFRLLLREAARL